MNKLANMRHWSERMGPGFGMSRPNMNLTTITPHPKTAHGPSPISPAIAADSIIHYSFNVPFTSDLAGPNTEDIVYATTDAVLRWTHPEDAPDDVPIHKLPVHANNVAKLRKLCKDLTDGPLPIEAHVKSLEPKRLKGEVTNVCLTGSPELVHKSRETILNDTPLALVSTVYKRSPRYFANIFQRCATVDIDGELVVDTAATAFKTYVVDYLADVARFCGVDLFLLGPKFNTAPLGLNGGGDAGQDQRWRVAIYGDVESAEHAKTRVLVFIDRLVSSFVSRVFSKYSLTCI
jgi:hypothetical protein